MIPNIVITCISTGTFEPFALVILNSTSVSFKYCIIVTFNRHVKNVTLQDNVMACFHVIPLLYFSWEHIIVRVQCSLHLDIFYININNNELFKSVTLVKVNRGIAREHTCVIAKAVLKSEHMEPNFFLIITDSLYLGKLSGVAAHTCPNSFVHYITKRDM